MNAKHAKRKRIFSVKENVKVVPVSDILKRYEELKETQAERLETITTMQKVWN